MRKIINTANCKLKGYFTGKFKNESTKDLEIAIQLNNLINEKEIKELKNFQVNKQYLVENIPASYFTLEYERDLNISLIASSLAIAVDYLDSHYQIIKKNVFMYLSNNGYTAKKIANFILRDENGDLIFVIVSKGTQKAAKNVYAKTSIANFEYYLYYLAAKEYAKAYALTGNISVMSLCLTPNKESTWTNETIRIVNFEDPKLNERIQEFEKLYKEIITSLDKNPIPSVKKDTDCIFCPYDTICKFLKKETFNKNQLKLAKKEISNKKELLLTDNQRELTEAYSGIFRTIASAGSGKTTTLAGIRTCNLISYYGCNQGDFLFLTFSERGVREIKEKISYWAKYFNINLNVNKLNIFTFNGFGQKIINENYQYLGFTKKPSLILRSEKLDLIANALSQVKPIPKLNYLKPNMELFNAKGAIIFVEDYIDWLTKYANDSNYLEVMADFESNKINKIHVDKDEDANTIITSIHKQIYEVFKIFDKLKKEKCYIEYDDQIKYALQILENKEFAIKYSVPHIVVDEYQDSDSLQIKLIQKLIDTPKFQSFVACGDDSQSIFSWRGATSDNIINFEKYFSKYGQIKDINLTDNFRSNSDITDFSNKLNDLNQKKLDKVVRAYKKGNGHSINLDLASEDTNKSIKKSLERLLKSGYELKDIAIISRTNAELTKVSEYLEEISIPYNLVVTQKLIEIPEVRAMLAFGKYLYYPNNYLYFSEFFQLVSENSLMDYKFENLIQEEDNLKAQLDEMSDEQLLEYFKNVVKTFELTNNGTKTFAKLFEEQDFTEVYDLASWLNAFIDYNETLTVEKDLQQYEAVTLMTAHSCKGSEFKAVIVLLNKFKYEGGCEKIDEERRSLFVAITRAKDSLDIIYQPKLQKSYNHFVDEIKDSANNG